MCTLVLDLTRSHFPGSLPGPENVNVNFLKQFLWNLRFDREYLLSEKYFVKTCKTLRDYIYKSF